MLKKGKLNIMSKTKENMPISTEVSEKNKQLECGWNDPKKLDKN